MPMHDWTRVVAGIYHDFRQTWAVRLAEALNAGILPPGYHATTPADANALRVRDVVQDRVAAVVELVSPGDKADRPALAALVEKIVGWLDSGTHLLVIDPFPPTAADPNGVHGAVWEFLYDEPYTRPADKPLTIVSYESVGHEVRAYVDPAAVGDRLPDMPLFLGPGYYVVVPLEAAYTAARGAVS